jgi:uncharacterized protein involved in exopolysaccharide biosynthesis
MWDMQREYGLSLRDTVNILYRRIFILKFLVPTIPLMVFIICKLVTPAYESTAKVIVTAKKENATLLQSPIEVGSSAYVNLNVDETDLNSEMELLTSLDLWMKVVKTLGPSYFDGPPKGPVARWLGELREAAAGFVWGADAGDKADQDHEAKVRKIARNLLESFKVKPAPKSKVMEVAFRYSDPDKARIILSKLLELYFPYHWEVYSIPEAQKFFYGQGEKFRQQYEEADAKLTEFKNRWGIAYAEKQKSELIGLIKQIQDSLVELDSNVSQYSAMLESLDKGAMTTGQLTPTMQRGAENTMINIIAVQLLRARQKQLLMAESFSPESRDYQAAEAMVEELRKKFRDAVASELDTLKAKRVSLDESLKEKKALLQLIEDKYEESRRLALDVSIAKERYVQYMAKEEEARMDTLKGGSNLVTVNILSHPFTPTGKVFPKTGLFVAGSFVFAIFLALGLILLMNFFDHTFAGPAELESHTGLPVLAEIGMISNPEAEKDRVAP